MADEAPGARVLTVAVGCLLIACGVLLYLEWWRAGELEVLNDRVNAVEGNVVTLAEHVKRKQTRRRTTPPKEKDGPAA